MTFHDSIKCPFCLSCEIEVAQGKTTCPYCKTDFELDDRGECIFVDTENPSLPVNGIFCIQCGLVQDEDTKSCGYCGSRIEITCH